MRANYFKYIFILVILCLIGYSIYTIYQNKEEEKSILESKEEEKIAMEKDIRLAIAGFDTMNPILSQNKNVQEISKLIFDPLITVNEDYQISVGLAKELCKVNETTYLIKLNQNVLWQNGKKFTSQDVKFTIEQIKLNSASSIYAYNVERIANTEILDEYTLRITLDREVPFFEYNLVFPIMNAEEYLGQDFINSEKNLMPLGTGRYKITSFQNGVITCEKNKEWWNIENENVKTEVLTINLYGTMGEVYNAFKLGNIDILTTSVNDIQNYVGTIGYYRNETKGREFDFLALNCESNILKYPEIRRALDCVIDKSSINAAVYSNNYYEANFPLDYGNYLYNGNTNQEKGVEKAKAILHENGWEFKSKKWQKKIEYKNVRLELKLVVNASNANRVKVAEQIKAQLENFGITVNILSVNDSVYDEYLNNKKYDMILTGTYTSLSPSLEHYFGGGNLANFNNAEASGILNEVRNSTDAQKIKEKYARLIEIYNTEIPYIALFYNKNTIVYNQRIVGNITPNPHWNFYKFSTWYRQADKI